MSRTPIIAGNWKLHHTLTEADALVTALAGFVGDGVACEVVVAPVATAIERAVRAIGGRAVGVAGQHMHTELSGAFTGELSATLLKDAGCSHVILGHSERRQLFGETNQCVHDKIRVALQARLTPIVCVGESLQEREADKTLDVVVGQVTAALGDLSEADLGKLVVAYEPIWAIGTGKTAEPADAQAVHGQIRSAVAERYGQPAGAGLRILYGGSVKPTNAEALLSESDIDGALVGGASLKAESFIPIIEAGIGRAGRQS